MKNIIVVLTALFPLTLFAAPPKNGSSAVDIESSNGTILKGSYFAAAKPGPGILLFHQHNRTRQSWDDVAKQLAAAGINTLTVDVRGHGETGGKYDNWTGPNWKETRKGWWPQDLDAAFQFLVSQPGVNRDVIGLGGAGLLGVDNSVETARRHPDQVKSLVVMSGETLRPQLQFLQHAPQLPVLDVVSDDDEYPPTVQAMELLYVTAASPSKKFIHYSAAHEAPWIWYEPVDVGKVPAKGGHGTDVFKAHPELPGIIVDWFVTTLIKTPEHAPADTIAAAAIINQLQKPDEIEQAAKQLTEARQKDPQAQLFPEITASIIGQDYMREGDLKSAIGILKLVALAYSDSADAHDNLAGAYLKDGQNDLARQHAEKALTLLNSAGLPASSWTNTDEYRDTIHRDVDKILKQLNSAQSS
ncbi:MAG TPA: hypothetical protein VKE30_00670 [Chthoniobacterales bacterium]|nr:hypothetical protein [Chthoniobacterales bacterium]